jgi:acetyl-CoA acyltransferase
VAVKNEDGTERSLRVTKASRPDTTLDKLAGLKSAFKADGVITAGNSSQISDGAAALLIMERGTAAATGLVPRARFVSVLRWPATTR